MKKDFIGKTVVITGASAGLGRAMAREFAAHGANVGLIARGLDGLRAANEEVEELGGHGYIAQCDVSNADAVEEAAQNIENHFGSIDVWINNAMISVFGPFKKIEARDFEHVTDVTYLGQVYGTSAALKRMLPKNRGTIILIGSALAYRGIPLQSAYCGAKHAIHGFFESLRSELIKDKSNVKLSMVQLPAMNTTQFSWVKSYLKNKPKPMGKIFEPEVAARAVVSIARDPERELYVGYPTVKTIWGNKVAPGFLDEYLAKTGYSGQQTDEPESPDRQNNLWHPLPGDHGAHGSFDKESATFSPETWMATHKKITFGILGAIAGGVCASVLLKSNKSNEN
ncbi:SDR family NAD(P)-dependent oxidoreductase [Hanamia caeni]|jgi:short-subunit dehydrogenase|uniref:SDR family NAD(P)-dependent oxidoreductase n=1 Tax=Hanamia caeni TaxID=2294116 RepID=A0A3M9NLT7_9BACT|nr:SDR family oxidoreductase [Hanamia caeni]RNI38731.1 SDR family NAD(P)-dependent oxidoreductase [Hanamia caeni]